MNISAIVTIPPYAPYIGEVAAHPIVSGLRLNTVMPLKEDLAALREIVHADPGAIVASRLFESLAHSAVPDSADIGDAAYLLEIGYRTLMLGDAICFNRDSVVEALNLLAALARDWAD